MNHDRMFKLIGFMGFIYTLLSLLLIGLIVYVVVHFIRKIW